MVLFQCEVHSRIKSLIDVNDASGGVEDLIMGVLMNLMNE